MTRSKQEIKMRQETDRILSVWDKKGRPIIIDGKLVKKKKVK